MPEEKETNLENGQATAASTPSKSKTQRQKTPSRRRQNDSDVAGGVGITGGGVVILPQQVLNELYHNYSIKQRRSGLKWFLFAAVLFNIWTIVIPWDQAVPTRVVNCCMLVAYLALTALLHIGRRSEQPALKRFHQILLTIIPRALWLLSILHFAAYIILQPSFSPRDVLGWAILLNFLVYVTLPLPLIFLGLSIGCITYFICLSLPVGYSRYDTLLSNQLAANAVLIATAALIGLLYYFMGEAKQKRAFLEAKKSLEVKMVIEEQSAEQERLLLSVLPKHVAIKMREDLGSSSSEAFKKIYMSRHENVSILYADIVGFTAISSTYSAQDLVKMLNELFARFDRLAEKYQQLRIKILGDCYYCISGAPDERPDHAVMCVHMGLSMVKAIKYVQQKANSPVDMRVGIHTGAVLAGILGQRQWQFDVYSKDVELANKMESSGKAGRVHISDKTLAFLNGEFEVEPAFGEKREELLRIAGLKTYFITKVVKPFASPCARKINETQAENSLHSPNGSTHAVVAGEDDNDDNTLDDEELLAQNSASNGHQTAVAEDEEEQVKLENFKQRLKDELVTRDGHENLTKDTNVFLRFKNPQLEQSYAVYREPYSSLPLLAALLVQCIDVLYSYLVLPRSTLHFINIAAPLVPIAMLVVISIAESFSGMLPKFFVDVSKRFNDITFVRELAAIIIALTIGLSNVIDMFFFVTFVRTEHIVSESEFNATAGLEGEVDVEMEGVVTAEHLLPASFVEQMREAVPRERFLYPSYLSNFGVLILIAIAVIAQLTHLTKILLLLSIAALHCYFNIFIMQDLYALEDDFAHQPIISTRYCASGLLVVAALALSTLARHMDHEDRVIFKWKTEVAEQKETANDMRQRNEALVYNVLPVHVAEHFMKNTKRSHDDLYSQSYAEVGVLFASMPNFSDFYSEETVNNQGLECLRFLNEVISDFDALLELPQFQDIIKIKTIGSTYMAASGINLQRNLRNDAPITERWSHLAVLVEFALELKHALQGINEQSFNHFVLKMGINHGPITAGVIGARKPHYDIWGNTVNVASRMESTGKAGAIQVTEETCNILQPFGYTFLQRGLVAVKGKGQLMTYYLQGKSQTSAEPVAPAAVELHGPESAALESTTELEASDIKTPLLNIKVQEPSAGCEGIAQEQGMGNGSAGQVGVRESQSLLE
ncbi:adenylate cyclase type 3 isoform X1 [Drosophila biarmipes]|uniref:adenylate cyclase type 3 isoform X1 n=2 Tax=Drosophila biarmipes TaxID=125945 RepID=UPI0007E87437|nr:adenylate cyclase type 3 isoform X1 [Drosophila biarmipes]XP_043950212.1 adenylate cyclase type 3 isoform X1 [Drosophila biarmipes]XP_043950213.1 adenylate cyclase type 3 isoform X1 [Drosophila biarmipes]XP_050741093.1 adenylate cyclase type 3 isoform X1 [Drosophila biarmipes]